MEGPLGGTRIKIERAKRHIRELEEEIRAFHARRPYEIIAYDDPQTGDQVYRVKIKEPVPSCFSGIIGDIVHNLRAALDQLTWQLVIVNKQQPRRRTGFPIGGSVKEFESDAAGKVKGVSTRAYRILRRLKPYKGGREFFWLIHELDRLDKHKSIIPVGAAYRHFIMTAIMHPPWAEEPIRFPPIAIRPADRQYPLQDGAAIFALRADARKANAEFQQDYQFTFEVAFGEGQIVDGEPILPTLQQLTNLVERVVDIFDRHCFR